MKTRFIVIIFALGMAAGLGVGWFVWGKLSKETPLVTEEKGTAAKKSKDVLGRKQSGNNRTQPSQTHVLQNTTKENQKNGENEKESSASSEEVRDTKHRSPPRTAKEVFDRILEEFESLDGEKLGFILPGRLQQLKDFGEEGSAAIQEFLRTQQDIALDPNTAWIRLDGRIGGIDSFRAALLETLYDMDDPTSRTANIEVLNSTSSGFEVLLTAGNLEKFSPGAYRSEALSAASEILARLLKRNNPNEQDQVNAQGDALVTEIVDYYQARELIPQVDEFIKKYPILLDQRLRSIFQFPVEEQVDTIERFLKDPKLKESIIQNHWYLHRWDFQNDRARSLITDNFNTLGEQQKADFIKNLGSHAYVGGGATRDRMKPRNSNDTWVSPKNTIEGKLKLLDGLEPQLNSPEQKTHFEKARKSLLRDLKQIE